MQKLSHKSKQFLVLIAKLLVVGGAFYFLYNRLLVQQELNWNTLEDFMLHKISFWSLLGILFLSFLNRFLEIVKWQNLVRFIKPIPLSEASKQVLGSLTLALFTPNGIGEYAGKALFFEKKKTKKIIFLNLICNGVQLLLTIIFGTLGFIYFNAFFKIISTYYVMALCAGGIVFIASLFLMRNTTIKGYSVKKLVHKIEEIPKEIHQKNMVLGFLRYVTFSHQYYFLFLLFGVHSPYLIMMATITSVYFLASSLPSFQFLDFAVKGGVAVYFFGMLGIPDWISVFITSLLWILNTVIPVLLGSIYVLNFKTSWKY